MMATYTQVATILQRALGQQEGLLVLEYFETRLPPDVARQRDVSEAEAALRLEIEKVRVEIETMRSDLTKETETMRADLTKEIEKVRADLTKETETMHADLTKEIEKVRADLTIQIERSQATQTRWAFLFWVSQMAVLVGVLFRLLA
jgi:vacuolar-type H+-ATPase subunit I/STV1